MLNNIYIGRTELHQSHPAILKIVSKVNPSFHHASCFCKLFLLYLLRDTHMHIAIKENAEVQCRKHFIYFIKSCYKRPSLQSYNKMTIVRVKLFYPDDGHFIVWLKTWSFITKINKKLLSLKFCIKIFTRIDTFKYSNK